MILTIQKLVMKCRFNADFKGVFHIKSNDIYYIPIEHYDVVGFQHNVEYIKSVKRKSFGRLELIVFSDAINVTEKYYKIILYPNGIQEIKYFD